MFWKIGNYTTTHIGTGTILFTYIYIYIYQINITRYTSIHYILVPSWQRLFSVVKICTNGIDCTFCSATAHSKAFVWCSYEYNMYGIAISKAKWLNDVNPWIWIMIAKAKIALPNKR